MKILFGLFLMAHALIHIAFVTKAPAPKPGAPLWPFDITKSWIPGLTPEILKTTGIILTIIATIGFVASGLGWIGLPFFKTYWTTITIISSIASVLLIAIFWHNWFIVAPLIDIALILFILLKNGQPA